MPRGTLQSSLDEMALFWRLRSCSVCTSLTVYLYNLSKSIVPFKVFLAQKVTLFIWKGSRGEKGLYKVAQSPSFKNSAAPKDGIATLPIVVAIR